MFLMFFMLLGVAVKLGISLFFGCGMGWLLISGLLFVIVKWFLLLERSGVMDSKELCFGLGLKVLSFV